MAEHIADFEWRGEGEEAEVVVYAPDEASAGRAFENALPAARLPGVVSPVQAAASRQGSGRVATSQTHAAPVLFSAPGWGILLVGDSTVESLGIPSGEVPRLVARRLSEVSPPSIGEAEVRAVSESGAAWAAEEGLIEEEDLPLLASRIGDPDALGKRALSAGVGDWTRPGTVRAFRVAEVLDPEGVGALGLEPGAFALVVGAGAEDLGRLSLAGHGERIRTRARGGDFGSPEDLPAAPAESEEARDLLLASGAVANYAAGRAALLVYALRRALNDFGALRLGAAWAVGGLWEEDGLLVHRDGLAAVGEGEAFVCGGSLAAATGQMFRSAPPFGVREEDGRWPWEEAEICARWAILNALGRAPAELEG